MLEFQASFSEVFEVVSSIPGLDVICGLSLLLVLVLAPRGFSPGTLISPSPLKTNNSNSMWEVSQVSALRKKD